MKFDSKLATIFGESKLELHVVAIGHEMETSMETICVNLNITRALWVVMKHVNLEWKKESYVIWKIAITMTRWGYDDISWLIKHTYFFASVPSYLSTLCGTELP